MRLDHKESCGEFATENTSGKLRHGTEDGASDSVPPKRRSDTQIPEEGDVLTIRQQMDQRVSHDDHGTADTLSTAVRSEKPPSGDVESRGPIEGGIPAVRGITGCTHASH